MLGHHPEAAWIDADHVHRGFAVDDPVGQLPACPARGRHAEGVGFGNPHVGDAKGGANHGVAVGGVGNRAVDDLLDAAVFERWHPLHAGFDVGYEALEVALEQVLLEPIRHTVGEARRGAFLIGAEDPAAAFLAQVPGAVGLAQHGQFLVALRAVVDQHGVFTGHNVLVLNRDRRDFQPDFERGFAGVVAGGTDHVLTGDGAGLFGVVVGLVRDDPLARIGALHIGHDRALEDLPAHGAGALGQRLGEVDRRDVTVGGVPEGTDQPVGIDQRPEVLDFFDGQHVAFHADGVGGAAVPVVLVHPLFVHGQTQVAGVVEAHRLPGFVLEGAVQLDRILVQLADRIGHVEQRQQPRSVPGRPGRQLRALKQDAIIPAFLGQMVEGRYADDAPADNNDAGRAWDTRSHGNFTFLSDTREWLWSLTPVGLFRPEALRRCSF